MNHEANWVENNIEFNAFPTIKYMFGSLCTPGPACLEHRFYLNRMGHGVKE